MENSNQPQKKKTWYSWYFESNLLYRILIGLVLGFAFGLVFKDRILWIAPLGDIFVRLLKMIMMPIIFSSLIVGVSSVSLVNFGKVGIRVFILYLLTSPIAIGIGLLMGAVFHPTAELTGNLAEATGKAVASTPLSQTLLEIIPTSIARAIVNETVLGVIFFALVFGMGIAVLRESQDKRLKTAGEALFTFFDGFAEVMMLIIRAIMQYAPIGVFALVAVVLANNGPKVMGSLGVVTIACFLGYALHLVGTYGIIMVRGVSGLSILRAFSYGKDPLITGFVTRSSNGTLPVTMGSAEKMGIPKNVYSFSLPLGATINMDGTAIYLGVCATFIALSTWGHGFDISQMGIILLTGTLAAIGTAGVPGAGAIMLLMVLEAVGLEVTAGSMVAGAYAMILGIDALLDMGRTATNVVGDLMCSLVVTKKMKLLDLSKWEKKK